MGKTMSKKNPRVTVLMSVYNSEEFIRPAIESILCQSFKDFEFLIINDGSKDSSLEIIRKYADKDKRIRLISRANVGLTKSLNEGVEEAHGEFIARMDSDDISTPDRLEKEVAFLDSHPDIALVGSNYTIIEEKTGEPKVTTNIFTHPDDLKATQVMCNQFGHGSILMRTSVVREMGGYDSSVGHVEDYHLWTRISRKYDIANIREPLYLYRSVASGVSLGNHALQIRLAFGVRDEAFADFLQNRSHYKLFSWNPGTCDEYAKKKSSLYRDYAYMYRRTGHPFKCLALLCVAYVLDHKNPKNIQYMKQTLAKRPIERWEFEFL